MPCTLQPFEIAYEERRLKEEEAERNKKKFGRKISTERVLEEVACQAVRLLAAEGKLKKASPLVQAWAKQHRMEDKKAGRPWPRRNRGKYRGQLAPENSVRGC